MADSNDGDVIKVKTTSSDPEALKAAIAAEAEALSRPKPAPKAAAKKTAEPEKTAAPRERLTGKASAEEPDPPARTEPKVMSHTGRTLTPLTPAAQAPADPTPDPTPEPTAEPAAEPVPKPATQAPEAPAAPPTPEPGADTADKLQSMSGELQAKADAKAAEGEQQQARIYDTKQYHLPIKPSHHHRKHAVSPALSVLLIGLVVILFGLIAVDMGLVETGFELPFDLF